MTDTLDTEVTETDPNEELLDQQFRLVENISHPDLDGFTLDFEDPPAEPERVGRRAKVVLAWEEYLHFLKEFPGKWVKVFEFSGEEAKEKARARARSVNRRLIKTQPSDIWEIKAVEDRDDEGKLTGVWKVYAQFVRPATLEEVKNRMEAHEAAVERGKVAAAARLASTASKAS